MDQGQGGVATDWYDKEGNIIPVSQANELLGTEYVRVGLTEIGPYTVSTVWLGLNHSFRDEGPPIIFETLVFTTSAWNDERPRSDPDREPLMEMDGRRYSTLQEAQEGHQEFCTLIRATLDQEPPTEAPEPENGHSGGSDGPDVAYIVAFDTLNGL